jgi:transposase
MPIVSNHPATAVDIAKSVFEVAVSIQPGRVSERRTLSRSKFLLFFATRPATTIVMEACGSSHHWARQLQQLGHRVVLLPPSLLSPYVVRNKTNRTDAKGILEAYRNEEIHPVPVKSIHQHTVTSLHRARSAWMQARTARINTVRGLLRELGVFLPAGARKVVPLVHEYIGDAESDCPDSLRPMLDTMCREIRSLETSIRDTEAQLERLAKDLPIVAQLRSIPGIGLLTATALVGFVGDVRRFKNARRFSSYLGLTPREFSTGKKRRLGRISKQGNTYLRHLLIHGARSLLRAATTKKHNDHLRTWALAKAASRGPHKAATAVANKLARIVWAVWSKDDAYRSIPTAA